jgi:curved DNA-binding protein CbpA
MSKQQFVDYYEALELSPNATFDTIERMYRYLAQRYHPDVAENSDMHRFTQIVEAYQTLRDPELRAAYDVAYERFRKNNQELVEEAKTTTDDCADRHRLLSLFYAQRRRNMFQPGIGAATLEQTMNLPIEILEFHLWYFREKRWIHREESGLLSITAEGVDQIETREMTRTELIDKRIEMKRDSASNDVVDRTSPELVSR